jgi:hypothetical protein
VCRFHIAAGWRHTNNISGAIVRSVTKLASITFWSLAFSYWFDQPWFHNWGKTCYCAHHTFLLGFPTGRSSTSTPHHQYGASRGGPGQPHHWVAWPRAGWRRLVVWAPGGSPHPLLLATSVFWWNMNFWVFSWNWWSSEIWCLDGPFSSKILAPPLTIPFRL